MKILFFICLSMVFAAQIKAEGYYLICPQLVDSINYKAIDIHVTHRLLPSTISREHFDEVFSGFKKQKQLLIGFANGDDDEAKIFGNQVKVAFDSFKKALVDTTNTGYYINRRILALAYGDTAIAYEMSQLEYHELDEFTLTDKLSISLFCELFNASQPIDSIHIKVYPNDVWVNPNIDWHHFITCHENYTNDPISVNQKITFYLKNGQKEMAFMSMFNPLLDFKNYRYNSRYLHAALGDYYGTVYQCLESFSKIKTPKR